MLNNIRFIEMIHAPEDSIVKWRKEAGVLRYLGNKRLEKKYGAKKAKTFREGFIEDDRVKEDLERLGREQTLEGLREFPFEDLESDGISKSLAFTVLLTLENLLRIEKYNLADQAEAEFIQKGHSVDVARALVANYPNLKKGRRNRIYSTKQEIALKPGPAPWPVPFVVSLVLEAMLKKRGSVMVQ